MDRDTGLTVNLHRFPRRYAPLLTAAVERTVSDRGGSGRGEINLILVPDREIRKLNRRFRGTRRITDVISFAYPATGDPTASAGGRMHARSPLEGDIFIARERSKKQAARQRHPWEKELVYLAVHGVLHLFGYTDYTPRARGAMFSVQDRIFQCLFS